MPGSAHGDTGDERAHTVEAGCGGHVERAPVSFSPRQIGGAFGQVHAAERRPVRREHPDTVDRGDVNVALRVDLETIRRVRREQDTAVAQVAPQRYGEGTHVMALRVAHVERAL